MSHEAILFDLDGTLIDTAAELADALNRTLDELGCEAVPDARVRGWIGHGARELLRRALIDAEHRACGRALSLPSFDDAWRCFVLHAQEHCGRRSRVYPGVREALERLHAAGVRLAVVTNKEGVLAHRLLAVHDLAPLFDLVIAGDTLPVKKPDAAVVQHVLQVLEVPLERALLVGDSPIDVQTARNAGIPVWVVPWGYARGEPVERWGADRVIAGFEALQPRRDRIAIA
jgi:phosphoglycolate phosphatase